METDFWKYRPLLLKGQDLPHVSNVSHLDVRFEEEKITTNIEFVPKEIHTFVICMSRTVYGEKICF